eukprot:TRINITY_DN1599_c0_g1_i1.p1 TRINITY_DN1599_c0_g1~~TRINITY_DN1599_c0_g1_i1.p1  ORF type:complete len:218 (+),score=66.52 TRINITY_DN1599_c0_g1_i1:104-757(+)
MDNGGMRFESWGVHNAATPTFTTPKQDVPHVRPDLGNRRYFEKKNMCVRVIGSESEMTEVQKSAASNDQLVVFKYVKADCPACAVVSVAVEKLCKKYAHFPYLKFFEVSQEKVPGLVAQVDKTPQVDAFLGKSRVVEELDMAPDIHYRRQAMAKVENLAQVEEVKGNKLSKAEMQKMMMKELTGPTIGAGDQSLMDMVVQFNREKSRDYFTNPSPPV